jgi:hypothetical protein
VIGLVILVLVLIGSEYHPIAAALVGLVAYIVTCWMFPLAVCRWCNGTGTHRAAWNRAKFRPCWRCDRAGEVFRLGAVLSGYFRRGDDD